jgi:hypothetical protein
MSDANANAQSSSLGGLNEGALVGRAGRNQTVWLVRGKPKRHHNGQWAICLLEMLDASGKQ